MSTASKRAYLKVLAGWGTFMRHIKMFRAALAALVMVLCFNVEAKVWTISRNDQAYSGTQVKITCEDGAQIYLSDNSWNTYKSGNITLGVRGKGYSSIVASGPNGVLDLRDIIISNGGVDYPITSVALPQYSFHNTKGKGVVDIYINNVNSIGTLLLPYATTDGSDCGAKKVVISGTFESVSANAFCLCTSLTNVVLESANLKTIGERAFFNCRGLNCDISNIVLPTVTSIGASAFAADSSASSGKQMNIKGVVDIKQLDYIGNSAFLQCSKLEKFIARSGEITSIPDGSAWQGAFFGTGLKHLELNCPKLNSVGTYVFKNSTSLTNIVIGSTNLVTWGSNLSCANLKAVTFYGESNNTVVDRILSGVSASTTTKKCTIYADRGVKFGWKEKAASLTATEEPLAPEDCFGVYRSGSRKAWLVNQRSPFREDGFKIIIR
jgi:hypothetical protein